MANVLFWLLLGTMGLFAVAYLLICLLYVVLLEEEFRNDMEDSDAR